MGGAEPVTGTKKKSVVIREQFASLFETATDEQAGKLVKAMLAYQQGKEIKFSDPLMIAVFTMLRDGIDQDNAEYEATCERRRQAAKSRWAKGTESESMQEHASASNSIESIANDAEMEMDMDTKKKTSPSERKKKATPPKHKYGEYQHVLLTDEQYQKLVADYGQEDADGGIQAVDAYCEEHGKTYSNYSVTVRKWGIERFREKREKKRASPQYHNRYNDFPQRDTDYKKLQKDWNRREYGGYHNRYNDFPQRDNDYKKIEEDWIRNAFGQ